MNLTAAVAAVCTVCVISARHIHPGLSSRRVTLGRYAFVGVAVLLLTRHELRLSPR